MAAARIPVQAVAGGARFQVRVTPRARRTALAGVYGEGAAAALKIALQAPPVEGRANAALAEFLSEMFDVSRSAIEITAGQHGRSKTILVRGRTDTQASALIEKALAETGA